MDVGVLSRAKGDRRVCVAAWMVKLNMHFEKNMKETDSGNGKWLTSIEVNLSDACESPSIS
jgi:hypothetical protein